MRAGRVVVGIVCLLALSPALARAEEAPLSLELDAGQQAPTLDFGDQREKSELTVRFLAAEPLAADPIVSLPRFQTAEGELLDAKVESSAKLVQGDRTVEVRIVFSDLEDAAASTYTSPLLLRGEGIADARATVTAKLEPEPVCGAALWATLLLLAGALLGLIIRWVVNVAAKLKTQGDRLAVVEAKLRGFEPLPAVFRSKLIAVRIQLARENVDASEATLTELESQVVMATQVAIDVTEMRERIAAQEKQIASMPNLGAAAAKLSIVLDRERDLIDRAINDPEFESTTAKEARATSLNDLDRVTAFFAMYADEKSREKLEPSLTQFINGEFEVAAKKATEALGLDKPLGSAAASAREGRPSGASDLVADVVTPPGFRGWLVQNSSTIAAAATALALVIVGLFTLFHPDTTFRTEGFFDALGLFAWGLGSAVAGTGLAELTGKLTAGKGAAA